MASTPVRGWIVPIAVAGLFLCSMAAAPRTARADGKTWKQMVDMSKNTQGSSPEGYKHTFALMSVRYLRFHMMGNTTNNHGHLVEVRASNTAEAAK